MKKTTLIKDYRALREKLNMIQSVFWGIVGSSQSSGSRFESGARKVPLAVAVLAHRIYIMGDDIDARNYQKKQKER